MSKSNAFENDLLKLIFNGVAIANLADNAASAPLTHLYLSLHTGDPGEAGDQTTNEISYTGYSRKSIIRDGTGWVVTGNSVSPAANVEFGEMTGGAGGVATHAAIGVLASGAGKILYRGALTPNINVALGITPRIRTTSTITEE